MQRLVGDVLRDVNFALCDLFDSEKPKSEKRVISKHRLALASSCVCVCVCGDGDGDGDGRLLSRRRFLAQRR